MKTQVLLAGRGYSGRGVRYELLDSSKVDAVDTAAARLANEETTMLELRNTAHLMGVRSMIVEVTEKAGFTKEEQLLDPSVQWKKVDAGYLQENWTKLFNAKDTESLRAIYRTYHVVMQSDVDAIMGKALQVSED